MLQPTLKNALIQIRPLAPDDLEPLFEVAKDPKIWEQHHANRFLKPEFKAFFQDSIESKGALAIIDLETRKIIGSSRYKPFDGFPDVLEIGWTFIAREYWGGKYNKVIKDLGDYIPVYTKRPCLSSSLKILPPKTNIPSTNIGII